MSAPPIPYTRQANFTNFATEQFPTTGQDLEAEFNKLAQSVGSTQSRLAEIQRDDGKLRNMSVHIDALDSQVRALLDSAEGAISALDSRVTSAEGQISSQGSAITALQNSVTAAEGALAAQATLISGVQAEVAGKADASHTHTIADVDGLQTALDGKLDTTATAAAATKLATPRTIKIGNTGKTFDGTADVTWTLTEIGINSGGYELPALDDLTNVSITDNTAGEVLQWNGTAWVNRTLAELGVAEAAHTHTIADVANLQSALDGKAAASHTHSASDITSGTLSDARLPSTMSGKTFTGGISATSVAIGDQLGYIYQSNSAGAVSVRVGTVGNEKFFAFSEDGRFYALSGGANFNGDVVVSGRVTASEFANPSGTPGPKYFVGDDAALHDVNLPHTIGVCGIDSPAYGYIKFGAAPGVIGWNGTTHIVESSLHVFGDVTANGYSVASSRELKQDIRPLDVDSNIIDRFQPVTFRYKSAPEREVAGLILEDVAEIFPLACTEDGIDYGQLVPLLIATIQHDRAQLRDLMVRVEALEHRSNA